MAEAANLRELFEQALDLAPAARAAFIATCPDPATRERLARMLEIDADDSPLVEKDAGQVAELIGEVNYASSLPPGSRIGPFELAEVLGEGGSSIVFRATRTVEGVRQEVALKLLRHGLYSPDAQRQFRRERLALAQLDHPGIARLIEGGVTESGMAYIVLDLVEGTPLTDHARDKRLDPNARLALFLQVCRAIEAAHRVLIVHRDIKPSNVLVTQDGQVKLLDFGIAKLLQHDDETQTRLPAFTPSYAAPEQKAGGLVTTATDVYALGVLLGQLMTGERLAGGQTPSGQVREGHDPGVLPAAPQATRRLLRGDLDNIVLKAIDEDPARRYSSASAFADDIERLIDGRPVAAHPPSRWYRTRKFVLRHRGGVLASVAFLIAIISALGVALWQARAARLELQRADALRDFMFSAFAEAEPSVPREGPPRVTEVVEQAIAKARADAQLHPEVRSELLTQLGAVLRAQGQLERARQTLEWNHEQSRVDFGERSILSQRAATELAHAQILAGHYAAARALLDRQMRVLSGQHNELAAQALLLSAQLASKQHELARADADAEAGLLIVHALQDENTLARGLDKYSNVRLAIGDAAGAITGYIELIELYERRYGKQHINMATAQASISRAYRRAGRLAEAETAIRSALEIDRATLPKDDWRRARHLNALVMVMLQQREFPAALEAAKESLRINRIANGEDHPETANDLNNVGMLHVRLADFPAALPFLEESLRRTEAKFGAEHYETALTRGSYGFALARVGKREQGAAELRHALTSLQAADEPSGEDIALTLEKLMQVEILAGDLLAASALLDPFDAATAKLEDPRWKARAQVMRATVLLRSGRASEARAPLTTAEAMVRSANPPDPELRVEILLLQALVVSSLNETATARSLAQAGIDALDALKHPSLEQQELAIEVRKLLK